MPVIKADKTRPAMKEAVVLDLGDLGRQAAKLREAAEQKAAQILADAERRAQELIQGAEAKGHEQGRAAGHEQGLAEGREQGKAEALAQRQQQLQQIQAAWAEALQGWEGHRRQVEREAREDVLELALRLAEKIVHRTVATRPEAVVDQVASALSHVLRPVDAKVRLHPEDKPLLEEALPSLMAEFANLQHVHLVEDATIGRGGCVVSHGQGQIDARIETQLARVAEAMLPGRDEPTPPEQNAESPAEPDNEG